MCTTEYEKGTTLDAQHEQFAAHATARPLQSLADIIRRASEVLPDHIAVRSGQQERTYAEVDVAAGRLAATLTAHGVQRGDRVGLYLHKSVESYIAIHGVLRAGAVYVPIDPLAPAFMVDAIADDCDIDVLITADDKRRSFDGFSHRFRTFIGTDHAPDGATSVPWAAVAESDVDSVPAPPRIDDPAYIIYTSGTTGAPKGILHTHRSSLAWIERTIGDFGLRVDDRMANVAPLHFDISLFDVLAAPAAGATTLLIPEPYLKMPASLSQLLQDERATNWYSAPTAALQLLRRGALEARDLSCLKRVILGGETLPPIPLAELMTHTPNARYCNYYGPAETNGVTAHWFADAPDPDSIVPIGHMIDDVRIALVDEDGTPVPNGTPGEALLSGVTTMQGYWNRPELTEAAFALRPSGADPTSRWYRTGDLLVFDGTTLRFVGRRDHQVKVRGHRVELEGVEQALHDQPGVELAVVGLIGDDEGTSTLAAVITATDVIDIAALRTSLATMLPPYAVPTSIDVVDAMPTTASGKVDRRMVRAALANALPDPVQEGP